MLKDDNNIPLMREIIDLNSQKIKKSCKKFLNNASYKNFIEKYDKEKTNNIDNNTGYLSDLEDNITDDSCFHLILERKSGNEL